VQAGDHNSAASEGKRRMLSILEDHQSQLGSAEPLVVCAQIQQRQDLQQEDLPAKRQVLRQVGKVQKQ
jgi:hypothetical protein